jgi:glycosyltransferase involved in cell wall biosynthesis
LKAGKEWLPKSKTIWGFSFMKVSVCIPTYNSGKFIGETIESVLKQTFNDYELIVCDNVSTDETEEVCRKFTDPRFKYLRFTEFVGQAENWNRALEQAKNEYVILLHSDDVLLPTYLEKAVAVLDKNEDVGFVHCAVRHIDENGKNLTLQQLYKEDLIDREEDLLRKLLLEGCVVSPVGVLTRTKVYQEVGNFTDQIVWGVDAHMWTRISLNFPVAYIAETLALYRQHTNSGTSGVMKSGRYGTDEVWMMNDIFKQIPREREDLQKLHKEAIKQVAHRTWCHAEALCEKGDLQATRVGIRRAVFIYPAMLFESRVLALWMASFLGYRWFKKMRTTKKSVLNNG